MYVYMNAAHLQDYTRSLEQLKESGLMDLFQRKYAHSLIVRLSCISKQNIQLRIMKIFQIYLGWSRTNGSATIWWGQRNCLLCKCYIFVSR